MHKVSPEARLSRREEARLTQLANAGQKEAANALVQAHLTSIRRLAMKLRWWGVPVEDLVQEGIIGLLHAMPHFQPKLGIRLLSFAGHGVRRRMFRAIALHRGQGMAAGGTVWTREFFRLRREMDAAHRQRDDAVTWLVDQMRVRPETARAALGLSAPMLHLDGDCVCGRGLNSTSLDPEQQVLRAEQDNLRTRAVRQALTKLPHREKWIVEQRLMVDPPSTYRRLGRHLGISGERVKQLEVRAIKRLKSNLSSHGSS